MVRNTTAIKNSFAVRSHSLEATSSGNGAEPQMAQKNEDRDDSSGNGSEDPSMGEGLNIERLQSDLNSKEQEIIDLKV